VGASGAQVSWRFENGSLLLSGIEAAGAEAKSSIIEDPEALDALNHLLQRLGLSISDTKPGMK
jgi:hypothetical protein